MAKEINRFVIGTTEYRSVSASSLIGIHNTLYCYEWATPPIGTFWYSFNWFPRLTIWVIPRFCSSFSLLAENVDPMNMRSVTLWISYSWTVRERKGRIRGEHNPVWDVSWMKASRWSSRSTTLQMILGWTRNWIILYPQRLLFKWSAVFPRFRQISTHWFTTNREIEPYICIFLIT